MRNPPGTLTNAHRISAFLTQLDLWRILLVLQMRNILDIRRLLAPLAFDRDGEMHKL